jgi:hexokinase
MISGGYLGSLCTLILQTAASEGVVPQAAVQDLLGRGPLSTPRLSAVISGEDAGTLQDEGSIRAILSAVVERAAFLTAINMSAPVIKLARSGAARKKYCISADGSVYFKLPGFRERAEQHLGALLKPYGVEHAIVHVEEAPIIGAAVAGLTEGS